MTVQAVLQTSFLGDMVLTTPLLERLARRGEVHVVATSANAALLEGHPAVRSVIVFDKRGRDAGWGGVRRVASALRATRAQVAYLAQGSLRTAAVARWAGVPQRIGFATSPGRVFYTSRVGFDRSQHHAERLWRLASHDAWRDEQPVVLRPTLAPQPRHHDEARAVLQPLHGKRLVALAPGSVWATKRWPQFAALARALADAHSDTYALVVIGAAGDRAAAVEICGAVDGRVSVVDATGELSLLGSAALLRHCDVLVTNDSAPLHLASAMNVPTVALFGPTVPALGFGPLAARRAVAEVEGLVCRPCHAHGPMTCPLGHWRCMRELTVVQVQHAVARVMSELSAR